MRSADHGGRLAVAVLLALGALGGCATPGSAERLDDRDGVSAVRTAARADAMLDAEGLSVVGTYASASGRLCRRLENRRGVPVARTSCRQANGEWRLGRALDGAAPRALPAPAAASPSPSPEPVPADVSADDAEELIGVAVRADETLWRFAMRTTGDPRNWQRIARLNGVDDVMRLEAGRTLSVPASISSPAL